MTTELNDKIRDSIEEILDSLSIDYVKYPNRISITCPIHGSDNPESLSIYTEGSYILPWFCWTNHCEEKVGKDMIGFMAGVLNTTRGGAIQWCAKYFGQYYPIKPNKEKQENQLFVVTTDIINRQRQTVDSGVPRYSVRKSLSIPAQYFLGRGFSKEILDRYDVGFCNDSSKPMYNRVIVPIYDDTHKYMVGCIGRSIFPKCVVCKLHHDISSPCPTTKEEKRKGQKWKHSYGFHCSSYFYNYWFAKPHIERDGIAILVEGTGETWRIEEAKIPYSLGMFGTHLTDERKILLTQSGASHVIIATDGDAAGQEARRSLEAYLPRFYNTYSVDIKAKDIGEMPADQVKKLFDPILEKIL